MGDANADRIQAARLANAGNTLTASGQTIARDAGLRSDALDASEAITNVTRNGLTVGTANLDRKQKSDDAFTGSTAAAGAAIYTKSDAQDKKGIKRDSDSDIDDFIRSLESHTYRYKDQADGKGERHGPMAQELEQSEIGRSVVREGPTGKMVDTNALTLALTGAVARMAKQMKERR